MSEILEEYYDALERLKARGEKITKDSVSIEAGRGKGSIKKSRAIFADLILAIEEASKTASKDNDITNSKISELEDEITQLKKIIEDGWSRELSLVIEIYGLKSKLKEIEQGRIIAYSSNYSK